MRTKVKVAILEAGYTPRAISRRLGIPEVRLSNIIRGVTEPNDAERRALQQHLRIEPDAFDEGQRRG